jgi:hypothetical protein
MPDGSNHEARYSELLLQAVFPLDLSAFLNTLMFECAVKPGLSRVILELLDFDKEG